MYNVMIMMMDYSNMSIVIVIVTTKLQYPGCSIAIYGLASQEQVVVSITSVVAICLLRVPFMHFETARISGFAAINMVM